MSQNTLIVNNVEYIIKNQIGRGSYAEVFKVKKVTDKKNGGERENNNTYCALKYVSENKIKMHNSTRVIMQNEISILSDLCHRNIINMISFCSEGRDMHLILEYAQGGDLSRLKKPLIIEDFCDLFQGITNAVHYLHSNGIIHRDIKPGNILMCYCNITRKLVLKLCDFGFAKKRDCVNPITTVSLHETTCGSPLYMAPELILQKKYTNKVDVWGLGVVFYEYITGINLYNGWNVKSVFNLIKLLEEKRENNKFHIDFSIIENPCLRELLSMMLAMNPIERYCSKSVMNHKFWNEKENKKEKEEEDEEKKNIFEYYNPNNIMLFSQESLDSLSQLNRLSLTSESFSFSQMLEGSSTSTSLMEKPINEENVMVSSLEFIIDYRSPITAHSDPFPIIYSTSEKNAENSKNGLMDYVNMSVELLKCSLKNLKTL